MPRLARRLLWFAAAVAAIVVTAMTGYMLIDGYSLFDAWYMAVITVATVGYAEIRPMSFGGRLFNSFIILIGSVTLLLAVGAMLQTIVELELGGYFPKRRMRKMIAGLKDHYILCGFGRVGRAAADELQRSGVPFVVLDRSDAKVDRAMNAGMVAALGDATLDTHLREVGVDRAKGLIAALATDADNLFLVISAKTMNPNLSVASRIIEEDAEHKFRRAGADAIFTPYKMAGTRLAQSIVRPHVVQFLNFAMTDNQVPISIEQVRIGESSEYVRKSLRQMQLRREVGVIVLAIRKPDGRMLFNPDPEEAVEPGDFMIAMGTEEQLARLNRLLAEVHA